jgi:hypothetical protein
MVWYRISVGSWFAIMSNYAILTAYKGRGGWNRMWRSSFCFEDIVCGSLFYHQGPVSRAAWAGFKRHSTEFSDLCCVLRG